MEYYKSTDLLKTGKNKRINYLKQMNSPYLIPSFVKSLNYDDYFSTINERFQWGNNTSTYTEYYNPTIQSSSTYLPAINTSEESPNYYSSTDAYPDVSGYYNGSFDNVDSKIEGLLYLMASIPSLKGKFKVTSIYRKGAMTTSGRPSNHSIGLAMDIIPTNGNFEELEKLMIQSPELVKYMQDSGLGILDEYSETGRKRRTGSTGLHMHIGPDKLAISDFNKLIAKYDEKV